VLIPDVLVSPHNASLGLTFYDGSQFTAEYRGDLFAAEHGSWNRANRTGYELILGRPKDLRYERPPPILQRALAS
jgi:glucose/arabinose dehydrogenase